MLKLRMIMMALALVAILYVKFFVNLNDLVKVATDDPTETASQQVTR